MLDFWTNYTLPQNSPYVRRSTLIELMDDLSAKSKNCLSCPGHCCTYAHNSMLVTPVELLDVYTYLKDNDRINDELIDDLKKCISEYRLDKDMMIGAGREFRRNYTCPFFKPGVKGCTVDPKFKPYGCLGFNPLKEEVKQVGSCTSYIEVLEKREKLCANEAKLNVNIKEELGLYWEKKNLPVALLDLINSDKTKYIGSLKALSTT